MIGENQIGFLREGLTDLLARQDGIEAALLYGSAARGDIENHSDIDVLLVCNGRKRLIFDAVSSDAKRCSANISLALYTRKELRFLLTAHSLFLLHLTRESIVLFDRSNGFLGSLFRDFEVKSSYEEDFAKSLDLLKPLETLVIDSPNQLHRLAQVYSLYRMFGVYLLAANGVYEFSKERMSLALAQLYPGCSESIRELARLRELNNSFFSRDMDLVRRKLLASYGDVEFYINALGDLAKRKVVVTRKQYADAVRDFIGAAAGAPRGLTYKLRTWFLLLVYDGLNIYSEQAGLVSLAGFDEGKLLILSSPGFPDPVRRAAAEVLAYMRSYSLKYFLTEEERIEAGRAGHVLSGLAGMIGLTDEGVGDPGYCSQAR